MKKKGVLVVNLGTPNSYEVKDVRKYLNEFLMDGRVIDIPFLQRFFLVKGIITPFRSNNSAKSYKQIWTKHGSPLKYYGEKVVKQLKEKLSSHYVVELAMRYQTPSIETALNTLRKKLVNEILILPLFPQYASASTGSVHQKVMHVVSTWEAIPNIRFINSYYDNESMIDVFAENGKEFLGKEKYDHILFSFHGLPERQLLKSDPTRKYCLKAKNCCSTITNANQFCYSAQCHHTAFKIADKLNLSKNDYTICFQSRLGKSPWKKPYTIDVIKKLSEKGVKKILVFCPAFVADCLETIFEISVEYQEEFEKMGGEKISLVPSLNDNPKWVEELVRIIQ